MSRYVGRKLGEDPTVSWKSLREILETEYGTVIDRQQAFISLTGIRQHREESISAYTEKFLALAGRAYGEGWREPASELIQQQMVSIFMEGLRSVDLKLRIFRKRITKIDAAIEVAKSEDQSN